MNQDTKTLTDAIHAGIEEKKGFDIAVADLSNIPEAVCQAFVICSGGSPTQVHALAESVEEQVGKRGLGKPSAIAGMQNAQWVAMDYGNVMVHIFVPEARDFYDLEHLWADAEIVRMENGL